MTADTKGDANIDAIRDLFARSIATKRDAMAGDAPLILAEMARRIAVSLGDGGKLLLCGNGGSAGDAQHLAAELVVRLRGHVERPSLPAIALTLDSSSLTACANDYDFTQIFARPLAGLGRPGDVLLVFSTSGQSANIIAALQTARQIGVAPFGFLGRDGGVALPLCELAFLVETEETGRIQETHITAGHAVLERVEEILFPHLF